MRRSNATSDWLADEHAQRDLEREEATPLTLSVQRPRGPRYLRAFRPPPQRIYRGGQYKTLRRGGR